jgi:hypothetical protein
MKQKDCWKKWMSCRFEISTNFAKKIIKRRNKFMKKLLFILCLTFSVSLFAQKEYVSNGISFKVGDTIQVGHASGTLDYYDYIKRNRGFNLGEVEPVNETDNISSKKYVIKDINIEYKYVHDAFYGRETNRVISFGKKGFLGITYYADIDNALKSGEIILDLDKALKSTKSVKRETTGRTDPEKLMDKTAFLYYVKGIDVSPFERFVEEYMFRYMNALYTRTHEDEFDYQKALSIAKNQMIQDIEQIDSSKRFYIYIESTLGSYDFENSGFPMQEDNPAYVVVQGKHDFNRISIAFSNFTEFRFVKMHEDDASKLIKKRKDEYGNINRQIFALINFKISHSIDKSNEPNNIADYYRQLIGTITSVEVYDDKKNLIVSY